MVNLESLISGDQLASIALRALTAMELYINAERYVNHPHYHKASNDPNTSLTEADMFAASLPDTLATKVGTIDDICII